MRLAIVCLVMAVVSCSAPPADEDPVRGSPEKLSWYHFKGSTIAEWSWGNDQFANANVLRCWEIAGQQDCLSAGTSSLNGAPQRVALRRFIYNKLPASVGDVESLSDGFECSVIYTTGSIRETVFRHGKEMAGAGTIQGPSSLWKVGYASALMRENDVHGTQEFDCPFVGSLVQDASVEALKSTQLTHDNFVGRNTKR